MLYTSKNGAGKTSFVIESHYLMGVYQSIWWLKWDRLHDVYLPTSESQFPLLSQWTMSRSAPKEKFRFLWGGGGDTSHDIFIHFVAVTEVSCTHTVFEFAPLLIHLLKIHFLPNASSISDRYDCAQLKWQCSLFCQLWECHWWGFWTRPFSTKWLILRVRSSLHI